MGLLFKNKKPEEEIVDRTICANQVPSWLYGVKPEEYGNSQRQTFEGYSDPCSYDWCQNFAPTEEAIEATRCAACHKTNHVSRKRENCKNYSPKTIKYCKLCHRRIDKDEPHY